jgi:hypothetical protein
MSKIQEKKVTRIHVSSIEGSLFSRCRLSQSGEGLRSSIHSLTSVLSLGFRASKLALVQGPAMQTWLSNDSVVLR